MAEVWSSLGEFITGIFGAFSSIINNANGTVIGLWLITVPICGLVVTYVTRLVHAGKNVRGLMHYFW